MLSLQMANPYISPQKIDFPYVFPEWSIHILFIAPLPPLAPLPGADPCLGLRFGDGRAKVQP